MLLAISPHLDDAVFGCGSLLAMRPGTVVATLFAGAPPSQAALTGWDADCGFASSAQALAQRRLEDATALGILKAQPCWLTFPDAQYRDSPPPPRLLRDAIGRLIAQHRPEACVVPMGLFHEDHLLAHDASLAALRNTGIPALAYEEAHYRRIPGRVQERMASWRSAGIDASAPRELAPSPRKRRVVECYASQLRGLAVRASQGCSDLDAPERYRLLRMKNP